MLLVRREMLEDGPERVGEWIDRQAEPIEQPGDPIRALHRCHPDRLTDRARAAQPVGDRLPVEQAAIPCGRLDRMAEQLSGTFDLLIEATRDGDEGQAQQVLATTGEIRSHCDRLIEALLREESQIEFHEAVAYSLLARHYKRVASHLANIATAVTGRLEDLDFPLEGGGEP